MEDILQGTTDRTILVFIPDPASTAGAGKTGLAHSAVTVSYTRVETDNDVTNADVTSSMNALTNLTDAHNDWGWKEVSSTLAPGLYRLDIADAVLATGAWYAVVQVCITSGLAAATPKAFRIIDPAVANLGVNVVNAAGTAWGSGAITAAVIADGAIDAGALAADCITAAKVASDVSAEIADAVLDEDITEHVAADSVGATLAVINTRASQTSVNTVDDFLDTEIASIISIVSGLPDSATIASDVWDEALAGHLAAGSTGAALNAAGSAGDPWSTALPGAYGAGTAGKIIGDNINATISSRATQTSVDTIDGIVDAILVDTDTTIPGLLTTIDTVVDAILVDTDTTIPTTLATLDTKIDTIDNFLDTEIAAILAAVDTEVASILTAVGTTLPATLTTIASYIDTEIATLLTNVDALPTNAELATALAAADDAVLAAIAALSIPTTTQISDAILTRNVSNVEATAAEHTLCTVVLAMLEHSISNTTLTIKRTDGSTTHLTKTLTTDADAEPITGIT